MLKEVEAVVESPVHKIPVEDLETSVDIACSKMAKNKAADSSLETSSLKMSTEESTSRKLSRDRTGLPIDVALKKGISNETGEEFSPRKVEKDPVGDLVEISQKNIYRERSDLALDVRKMLWDKVEASADVAQRKISRDMMGVSIDSASGKMTRDDPEYPFDSRRMSQDTGSRKHKGEYQLDSSVRALAKEKMVETARTPPRKISRDELEYCADVASLKMLPREKREALVDTSSSEFSFEPITSKCLQRNEPEKSAGSLRRRMPRMLMEDAESSIDTPTRKISWDRVDIPKEMPKQFILREESSESSSLSPRNVQPDLMLTSQVPWKPSSDFFTVGPLSQLVYDGILEKSCSSMFSAPNLSAGRLLAEMEPPPPPPPPPQRVVLPAPSSSPSEAAHDKSKDKEKSKKPLKLKNLFKKKSEQTPEKL